MVLSLEELQKLMMFIRFCPELDFKTCKNSGQIYNEEQINFFKERADNDNHKCSIF